MISPPPLRALVLCAALLAGSGALASAATVADERFADGNRTGQGAVAPLSSLNWYYGPTSGASVVTDGRWRVTPTANTLLAAHFNPVALGVGDTLSVSFTYRHATATASSPLRVALLNSNGSLLSADTTGVSPAQFSAYDGYVVFTSLGSSPAGTGYTVRKNTTTAANLFGLAENTPLAGSAEKRAGATEAGALHAGSITLTREAPASLRAEASFAGVGNAGVDSAPVTSFDTLAIMIAPGSGAFDIGDILVTTTGSVAGPRVLRIDRRGGADYSSIAAAIASGIRPGDTLRLEPGSGPYREPLYLATSGTPEAPIVFDGSGETVTGFNVLGGFQTVNGVTTRDLTSYWTSGVQPQGFAKVDGRWKASSVTGTAPQPLPFVLTYRGERLVQSATVRTTPPPGSPPGTLGRLGQLTAHATLSDDGNTLTLLPGVSTEGWEISVRAFAVRVLNTSHQTYRNLKATGSLNDGINLHGTGTGLLFENIEGFHNLDEGFSAHDNIACEIRGGVFYRNDNGLVNVNASVLTGRDIVCHDNLGHGLGIMNDSSADLVRVRLARNGVRELAVYHQAAVTLARTVVSGGGWTQKPRLSCNETGGLSAWLALDLRAGVTMAGEAPVVSSATAPLSIETDSLGTNLEVFYYCPPGSQSQLQVSTDLLTWQAAGPIWGDDSLHRWAEPAALRRFYRVVEW